MQFGGELVNFKIMKKLLSILFIAFSLHVFGQDPLILSQQLTTAIQIEQATIVKLNTINQGQTASITILNTRLTAANKTIDSCKIVIAKLTNAGTGPIVVTPPPAGDSFTPYIPLRDVSTLPVTKITWKQLQVLKGITNKNYQLAAGTYTGQANPTDCSNIFIDLSLSKFVSNNIPTFELGGFCHDITFSKPILSKCSGAFVSYKFPKVYNSADASTLPFNLTIQDGTFDQQGAPVFQNGGMINSAGELVGAIKGFKFIYNTITNSPNVENIVWGYNLENFFIANNIFNNVNSATTDHNGLFMVSGNGICVNNKGTVSEGSMIRLNPFLISGENTTALIQNNTYASTSKYGAFEVQIVPTQQPYVKPLSSILVDHNTAGDLGLVGRGTDAQWNSALIDIYPCATTITVSNNLGWNMFLINGFSVVQDMIDRVNTDGDIIKTSNNFYYTTLPQAVVDGVSYKSRFVGIGAQ